MNSDAPTSEGVPTNSAGPTNGAVPTNSAVLVEIRRLIGEVIGEEYIVGIDIERDTTFGDDLEMESIEFVALAEALQDHYGDDVDFVAWIAELELDDLIAMNVGAVADFVAGCIDRRSSADG